MIPSRWDRPGQSAQGPVSPTQAWFAANAARICGKPRSTSVLPFHGYRAWCTMVHQTRNLSDATPIARGNTPLTIPVLTTGIGACATDRRLCPTFARNDRNVSPCSTFRCCPVRDSHECTIECAHIHWSENHDLSVLPPFASYFS